jgi:hypothetical protein
MVSFFFQTFWMYILAGLGEKAHKSPTEKNTVVAAFMLFGLFYNVSAGNTTIISPRIMVLINI